MEMARGKSKDAHVLELREQLKALEARVLKQAADNDRLNQSVDLGL